MRRVPELVALYWGHRQGARQFCSLGAVIEELGLVGQCCRRMRCLLHAVVGEE